MALPQGHLFYIDSYSLFIKRRQEAKLPSTRLAWPPTFKAFEMMFSKSL